MLEAVAAAADVPADLVRRAVTLTGGLAGVAAAARRGAAELSAVTLAVGRPLPPMLAQSAPDLPAALERTGRRRRSSGSSTASACRCTATGTTSPSSPAPWTTSPIACPKWWRRPAGCGRTSRARRRGDRAAAGRPAAAVPGDVVPGGAARRRRGRAEVPLTTVLFDVLHVDGVDVLDSPGRRRGAASGRRAASPCRGCRAPEGHGRRDADAEAFAAGALAQGHEGVVVKALDAPYAMGRRGAGWVKVKPRAHARPRRARGRVGARPAQRAGCRTCTSARGTRTAGRPAAFVMLGKTFKGLTDEMLTWQTERLLGAGDAAHPMGRRGAARTRRRGRLRRRPDLAPLSGRGRAALRPRARLPSGQGRRRGGHHRHGAHLSPVRGPGGGRRGLIGPAAGKPDLVTTTSRPGPRAPREGEESRRVRRFSTRAVLAAAGVFTAAVPLTLLAVLVRDRSTGLRAFDKDVSDAAAGFRRRPALARRDPQRRKRGPAPPGDVGGHRGGRGRPVAAGAAPLGDLGGRDDRRRCHPRHPAQGAVRPGPAGVRGTRRHRPRVLVPLGSRPQHHGRRGGGGGAGAGPRRGPAPVPGPPCSRAPSPSCSSPASTGSGSGCTTPAMSWAVGSSASPRSS